MTNAANAANGAAVASIRVPAPRAAITAFLDELDQYVVLRNHDIWANFERGSDIDVLTGDAERASRLISRHLGKPLITIRRAGATSYVFRWGHIDLLSNLSWRGAHYLETAEALQHTSVSALGFKQPNEAYEALVSWFSSLLAGGFFKERYAELITQAAHGSGDEFRTLLHRAAGKRWGERLWLAASSGAPQLSEQWARSVRRAVWWRAFVRTPLRTIGGWVKHWRSELMLRIRPPLPWCVVLGPDGSGKSSVISELEGRFARSGLFDVARFHWRPGVLSARSGAGPVTDPHGQPPRGSFASALQLLFLMTDWTLGYWGGLVHQRAKGRLVIYDRHFIDLMVDPMRYRYGGPPWLPRWVARLIPTPDLVFLMDAPPDVLLQRKQEVTREEVVRQRTAYRDLVTSLPNGRIVDAARELSQVVDAVERIILAHLMEQGNGAGRLQGTIAVSRS